MHHRLVLWPECSLLCTIDTQLQTWTCGVINTFQQCGLSECWTFSLAAWELTHMLRRRWYVTSQPETQTPHPEHRSFLPLLASCTWFSYQFCYMGGTEAVRCVVHSRSSWTPELDGHPICCELRSALRRSIWLVSMRFQTNRTRCSY